MKISSQLAEETSKMTSQQQVRSRHQLLTSPAPETSAHLTRRMTNALIEVCRRHTKNRATYWNRAEFDVRRLHSCRNEAATTALHLHSRGSDLHPTRDLHSDHQHPVSRHCQIPTTCQNTTTSVVPIVTARWCKNMQGDHSMGTLKLPECSLTPTHACPVTHFKHILLDRMAQMMHTLHLPSSLCIGFTCSPCKSG